MRSSSITPTAFTSASLRPPRLVPTSLLPRRHSASLRPRAGTITCEAASVSTSVPSTTVALHLSPDEQEALSRVGSRVRVKAPLKVYHIPKVPELDITGLDGTIKQYVCVWKEKRITANLPFKVEFLLPDGAGERPGPIKFVAHLKDDEFEYI